MFKPFMTPKEYAEYKGKGVSSVSNWKKRGLIEYGEAGLIDVRRSDMKVNAAIDPTRGRPSRAIAAAVNEAPPATGEAPNQVQQVADVRVDLIREQTIARRMKNALDAGALVPFEDAAAKLSKFARLSRERMHSIVRTYAERLAAEREPRQIVALLEAEIDAAFSKLAQDARAGRDDSTTDELPPVADVAGSETQEAVPAATDEETGAAA